MLIIGENVLAAKGVLWSLEEREQWLRSTVAVLAQDCHHWFWSPGQQLQLSNLTVQPPGVHKHTADKGGTCASSEQER